MLRTNKVIWLEGMFLQPQHFQQQDRYLENLIFRKQQTVNNHWWGFSQLELDKSLLSLGKIGINSASGIFPDGSYFNIPTDDPVPIPFTINEGMSNHTIFLAIPLQPVSREVGMNNNNELFRYHAQIAEIRDNNAESEQIASISIGTLASKILSEYDESNHYTLLPISKIIEARANHAIILDDHFLPPCLDVQEFPSLKKILIEIYGLINHRAHMLASRLTNTQQSGTAEVVDFMLLQTVNRYEPLMHYLMHKKPLHPQQLFSVLTQLLGEICTFTAENRRIPELILYQHHNLQLTFLTLAEHLRQALTRVLQQNATSIVLQEQQYGLWIGQFLDKELIHSCSFVLAVYADLPLEKIRMAFATQIKIAPLEQIQILVSRALPGIDLQHLTVAPRQIPYHANFSYFTINSSHELWKQLSQSGGIAFHVGNHFPGLKLELWAIK